MSPQTGLMLRMTGPLIEVVCLIALLRDRANPGTFLGQPVEYLCYGGFFVGFAMVVAGLALVKPARKRRPPLDES